MNIIFFIMFFLRLIPIFPCASAKGIQNNGDNTLVIMPQPTEINHVDLKAGQVWVNVGVNPDNFNLYIQSLSPEQKIQVVQDKSLTKNYLKLHELFLDIADYISKKAFDYDGYKKNLIEACEGLSNLEKTIINIKNDLETNKEKSRYSPTSDKVIVLAFPEYSSDFKTKIKESSFYESERHWIAVATKKIIPPFLTADDMEAISNECSDNYVETMMFAHLNQMGGIIGALNIDNMFTFEQFKEIFSNRTIERLVDQINDLKENLDKGIDTVEKIVAKYVKNQLNNKRKNMEDQIHLIYQEHQKIINACSGRTLTSTTNLKNGRVIGWDVNSAGFVGELRFRFRVGDPEPLKDEL